MDNIRLGGLGGWSTAHLKTVSPLERVYSYADSVDVRILITVFIPLADHEPSKDRYVQFDKSPYLLFFSTQIVQCTSPSLYGPGQLADKVTTLHIKYSQPMDNGCSMTYSMYRPIKQCLKMLKSL